MAASLGNKNAMTNGGRKLTDFDKVAKFKGLILDFAINIMQNGSRNEKKSLLLRAINGVLPREITGQNGGDIAVKVIVQKYAA